MRSIHSKIIGPTAMLLVLIACLCISAGYLFVKNTVYQIMTDSQVNISKLLILFVKTKYQHIETETDRTAKAVREQGMHLTAFIYNIASSFCTLSLNVSPGEQPAKTEFLRFIAKTDFDNASLIIADPAGNTLSSGKNSPEIPPEHFKKVFSEYASVKMPAAIRADNNMYSTAVLYHKEWKIFICSLINLSVIEKQKKIQTAYLIETLKKTFSELRIRKSGYIYLTKGDIPVINKPPETEHIGYSEKFDPLDWDISVAVPVSEIKEPANNLFLQQTLLTASCFFVAVGFISFWIKKISQPLINLSEYANRKHNSAEQSGIRKYPCIYNDEVGLIAGSLLHMESELTETIKNIRSLHQRSIRIQEEERRRIARDLHDTVIQDISAIIIRSAESGKHNSELKKCVSKIRDIAYGLMPLGLDMHGLPVALEELFAEFSAKTNIGTDFTAAAEKSDFSDDISINLFRIVQEFLNNTEKHSEADMVVCKLVHSPPDIILRIYDNGKGFDSGKPLSSKCMGFRGIEERIIAVGGHIDISSKIKKGTKITITLKTG